MLEGSPRRKAGFRCEVIARCPLRKFCTGLPAPCPGGVNWPPVLSPPSRPALLGLVPFRGDRGAAPVRAPLPGGIAALPDPKGPWYGGVTDRGRAPALPLPAPSRNHAGACNILKHLLLPHIPVPCFLHVLSSASTRHGMEFAVSKSHIQHQQ